LYVLPKAQGRGIGTELLQVAQRCFDHLQLGRSSATCGPDAFMRQEALRSSMKRTAREMRRKSRMLSIVGRAHRLPVAIRQRFSPKGIWRLRLRPRTIQVHGLAR
jgi:GNAT superfamily N-acetyltransferase